MDHKPWRWRRKPVSETTIKSNGSDSVEDQNKDAESLKSPSNLSDRLQQQSDVCDRCSCKDELIRKHRRIAEQALAGQEMERAEAAYMKEELEKAEQQGELAEKKLAQLNAALNDCKKEIESLKQQQDEKVQRMISKEMLDCKNERTKLEAKLSEANRRISNLSSENGNLMKALICKERQLYDLSKGKDELESEVCVLTGRLESVEKENEFLKFEACNEEKRAKQISQLEAECLQLRHLVKRRLQSEVQGTDHKRVPKVCENSADGMSYLIEENETLREIIALSDRELQSWAIVVGENKDDYDVEMQKFAIVSSDVSTEHYYSSWLDEILKVILEEQRVSKRDFDELLRDISIALGLNNGSNVSSEVKAEKCAEVCGLLTWEGEETTEDASFTKTKIRKSFGSERSKSDIGTNIQSSNRHNTLAQMVAIQSALQDENRRLKEKIDSLQKERELFEDQIENQRLISEDLNTQLTVAKSKLNATLHKLSSLEVELDHRNNCCDELESTCLELQLQLETVSRKQSPNTYLDAVARQLFDQALCPVTAIAVHDKKPPKLQGSSLRDHLFNQEHDEKTGNVNSEKSIVAYTGYKPLPLPEPKVSSPEQAATLAVVPSKRAGGGFGFIRKLFLRRKKGCAKTKAVQLQRNMSNASFMKQRDVLLLV